MCPLCSWDNPQALEESFKAAYGKNLPDEWAREIVRQLARQRPSQFGRIVRCKWVVWVVGRDSLVSNQLGPTLHAHAWA